MDVIAEDRLDMLYPDGEMVPVHIRIGRPQLPPQSTGEWFCLIQADGLRFCKCSPKVFGEGSFHTLMLAFYALRLALNYEVEQGAIPHWQDGTTYRNIDEMFCRHLFRDEEPK